MVITVRSPYADDETRSKEVSKMVEEFIEANWDAVRTTVPVGDVAFGVYGNKIQQSGKPITLRAYSFFESVRRLDVYGARREYLESLTVDIYVLNNETDDARDPRAIAIRKWLDGLFVIHQGRMTKGIYEIDYRGAHIDTDPVRSNITRVKATVDVKYIMDITVT